MKRARFMVLGAGFAAMVLVLAPRAKSDGPREPAQDGEVLEKLPSALKLARPTGVPLKPDDAVKQAHALVVEARKAGGDPRLLGRAQAVLGPWWNLPTPPVEVRLLKATLLQSLHHFEEALVELNAVLAVRPGDPQALLTRATVLQVLGRFEQARASCAALEVPPVIKAVCVAQLDGLTGHAARAREELQKVLAENPASPERGWALSVEGDLAVWAGDEAAGIALYSESLALDPDDNYTRGAWVDILLDQANFKDALGLLEGHVINDVQLLRYVLVLQGLKDPRAAAQTALLVERVEETRRRGDTVHQREESRFALAVEHDPARALELAKKNWAVQHEPWDLRVLLEAALAAKDPAAAAPALTFLKETGFEDRRLRTLAASLEALK